MAVTNLPATTGGAEILERVVVLGDLSQLTPIERVQYYRAVCESVGLNPLTKPFDYITLNGKLTLYAKRDAAEQLRAVKGISVTQLERQFQDDLYIVTAHGVDKSGRTDCATGAVSLAGLRGEAKANALMKAETKAKRRLTLSLGGLGWLDETEVESIPGAQRVAVDLETGVIDQPEHDTPKRTSQKRQEPKAELVDDESPVGLTAEELAELDPLEPVHPKRLAQNRVYMGILRLQEAEVLAWAAAKIRPIQALEELTNAEFDAVENQIKAYQQKLAQRKGA